ncbi:hypothetical protein [Noviherbaspirillum massiliense]|uniref:hypothetical protein n=1 Tax=Noviherbaspirillum massiliense TaxID=1465823 RepID=UPI0011DD8839|nr:hypothetical protein [Noviherbaspirillum massiliense]
MAALVIERRSPDEKKLRTPMKKGMRIAWHAARLMFVNDGRALLRRSMGPTTFLSGASMRPGCDYTFLSAVASLHWN